MKVLYAIQGTGNGHISRAKEIIPFLHKFCKPDILVSGTKAEIKLPFEITYQFEGMSFAYGKSGGIDLWNTYNEASLIRLIKEYEQFPAEKYDLIINDFEPISAWAAQFKDIPCISLSHQSALLQPEVPLPSDVDLLGKFILKNFAPAHDFVGFHFQQYNPSIFTPVIRKDIRQQKVSTGDNFTVYLPAWDDLQLANILSKINVRWHIFSKTGRYLQFNKNINISPIQQETFTQSMLGARGVLCGAGFETPAEALFLGKKLMVIPMKTQYEQQCNAAALQELGVPVIKTLKLDQLESISQWVESTHQIQHSYPDQTEQVLERLFEKYERLKKRHIRQTHTTLKHAMPILSRMRKTVSL